MLLTSLSLASALAPLALGHASSSFGKRMLWGEDGMGKMIEKRIPQPSPAQPADSQCTNGPYTRACWENGYSIATDFDQKAPTTGNTVSYQLELTQTDCNPDGNADQPCVLINNQFPGPTIFATWGDQVEITVTNSMETNGTSIHWHGVRQLNSCGSDGVGGITECPIPPGSSFTYSFHATQYGTSWYHSHHSSQYGMGAIGAIQIDGPTTDNWDIDLGTMTLSDWYYQDAWIANLQTMANLQKEGGPPAANNLLVNGTGKAANGQGKYAQYTLEAGKRHLLRFVNPSVDNYIRFSLDDHPFTVVTTDFIPVRPVADQQWLLLGPGQRQTVVIEANQTAGNYFFRAEVAADCLSANDGSGRALFTYSTVTPEEPTDSNVTPPTNGCTELNTVPYWPQSVSQSAFQSQVQQLTNDLTEQVTTNGKNLVYWALNLTSMRVDWEMPTLEYVATGNTSYPLELDIVQIPNEGTWTYWIIQALQGTDIAADEIAAAPPPHPIHLHGHDFFTLGSGLGQYNSSLPLNFENPPRRDTTTLPSRGWLAIAFLANNPGAWLMHCHIAWHISEGLGVQFLEAPQDIVLPDMTAFNNQCSNWKQWNAGAPFQQDDSGL